ncbi:MAG: DNA repair protein RadC [Alphaproteobacteria bacterium]|nr:DNA repair protein RadC [Alphaproteobacteria bacterium]
MKSPKIQNHAGHRERIQDKFLATSDCQVLPDYELLELILMRAIPRIDVKPLAKDLLNYFGSLSAIFSASPEELKQFPYIKKSALTLFKLILETNQRMIRQKLKDSPVLQHWENLIDYCCLYLQHKRIEHFMVLYLDSRFRLLRQEIPQTGTTDRVSIYPREILKQALVLGAHAVVIVHNHPSGYIEPSRADCEITVELYNTLKAGGIQFLDHLIVGSGRRVYSFSAHGHLTTLPPKNIP